MKSLTMVLSVLSLGAIKIFNFKEKIKVEIDQFLLKVSALTLMVSVIIFALFKLMSSLDLYFAQYQDHFIMTNLFYGSIVVVFSGIVFFSFAKKTTRPKVTEPPAEPVGFDVNNIALSFLDGFVKGLKK